jgi:hypothetical protein
MNPIYMLMCLFPIQVPVPVPVIQTVTYHVNYIQTDAPVFVAPLTGKALELNNLNKILLSYLSDDKKYGPSYLENGIPVYIAIKQLVKQMNSLK